MATRYSTECRIRYGAQWAEFLTAREEESLDVLYHTTEVPWFFDLQTC